MLENLRYASKRTAISVLIVVAAVSGGCRPSATPAPAPEPPEALSIFYTCDTRGHISPCNCKAGVAGGIARRKSFIAENRPASAIVVDAGNVTAGPREWELLELDYILKGYQQIGYDAVNVGAREVALTAGDLRKLRKEYPFFISANVHDDSGTLLFEPYRIVTLPQGFRIGILGVVENSLLPDEVGAGVNIATPGDAIATVLPDLKDKSDFVVLLAFTAETTMKALAERFFEIDVVIGGDVEQPSATPLEVNRSHIAYITDKGKSVGWMDLRFIGGQAVVTDNTFTLLLDDVPDDPGIVALVEELRLKQVQHNYPTEKDDEEGLSRVSSAG